MSLLSLPNEILVQIASRLDSQSLFALGLVGNRRLLNVSRNSLKSVKIDKLTEYAHPFLISSGFVVQRLDFSNCGSKWTDIQALIIRCPKITELNLVNANVHCLKFLPCLKELEVLSMTVAKRNDIRFPDEFSLRRMRNLYLEAQPGPDSLYVIIRLINASIIIERIHINIFGRTDYWHTGSTIPVLDASRWNTINTVICSQHLTMKSTARFLLMRLFAHHNTERIQDWIQQDQLCYIYEHGELSGVSPTGTEEDGRIKLLKQFQTIDTEAADNDPRNLRSPWGPSSSLRVSGTALGLDACLSSMLRELDLTNFHGNFIESFRLGVIASAPSLEVLACSLCFVLPTDPEEPSARRVLPLEMRLLRGALEKLKLKKFFVSGLCRAGDCSRLCSCNRVSRCNKCEDQTPLTTNDLVDVQQFSHLEELNLRGVNLTACAFRKIINPNLHTVRLCLNSQNDFSGLLSFVRLSRNLKYFKLEGFDLQLQSEELWEALLSGRNLRQICLRVGRETALGEALERELQNRIVQVVGRLDSVHIHCQNSSLIFALHQALIEVFPPTYLSGRLISDVQRFCSRVPGEFAIGTCDGGRALCSAESSVGIVSPIGWSTM